VRLLRDLLFFFDWIITAHHNPREIQRILTIARRCAILRAVKRMTRQELDDAGVRSEEIGLEQEKLRSRLQEQIEE
jgi:hypothetical protein